MIAEQFLALLLSLPPHGMVVRVDAPRTALFYRGDGGCYRFSVMPAGPTEAVVRSPLGTTYRVPAGELRPGDWYGRGK